MVVNNAQHETAIVIRRDGNTAVFVRFRTGKLSCERMTETSFREQWHESPFRLTDTLNRYFDHIQTYGCTQEALKGLEKLRARDRHVVSSLF